ncbi:type II toxin-antitoxin system RelE family toxin [Geomonas limicola]|uniref:type II toxin-antitoxin system RelE family toxin n=1 Tax=Geomonas limicola TaxID=2740186 RepID=UPI00160F846F
MIHWNWAFSHAYNKSPRAALATRLATEPDLYEKPLRGTLAGFWKLRVGNWQVVYQIRENEVIIYTIKHRSTIYETLTE